MNPLYFEYAFDVSICLMRSLSLVYINDRRNYDLRPPHTSVEFSECKYLLDPIKKSYVSINPDWTEVRSNFDV